MSLAFDERGDTCEECGVFDFLPSVCPNCSHTFCRDHINAHHLNLPAVETRIFGATSVDLDSLPQCSPGVRLSDAKPDAEEGDEEYPRGATKASESKSNPAQRSGGDVCFECGSALYLQRPCDTCGHIFCSAHRFHGHEEEKRLKVSRPSADRAKVPLLGDVATERNFGPLEKFCLPFITAEPLRLAPVGYSGEMLDLCFLLFDNVSDRGMWALDDSLLRSGPEASSGEEKKVTVDFGVCSASIARESSVGQMMERLQSAASKEWEAITASSGSLASPTSLRSPCPFTLFTIMIGNTDEQKRIPQIEAKPFTDLGAISRQPFSPNTFLLFVGNSSDVQLAVSFLRLLLFTNLPLLTPLRKDNRIRRLLSQLYLDMQKQKKKVKLGENCANSIDESISIDKKEEAEATSNVATVHTDVTLPVNLQECSSHNKSGGQWPFRTPPPLSSHPFGTTKVQPVGAAQAGTPRLILAVFVEDIHAGKVIQPFCIAANKEWPLGRLLDRIREEVGQVAKVEGGVTSLSRLYLLSTPNLEGIQRLEGNVKVGTCLKEGATLWLGSSEDGVAPLQAEVNCLKQLKGKEQTALKMTMMKNCVVM